MRVSPPEHEQNAPGLIALTPRLILRRFHRADFRPLAAILSDSRVMRFSLSGPKPAIETGRFLRSCLAAYRRRQPSVWAVVHREEGVLIGYCGHFVTMPGEGKEIDLAYRLDPRFWGRGLATEAAVAAAEHAFKAFPVSRLIALIDPENIASRRVAEKAGMTFRMRTLFRNVPVQVYATDRAGR